MRCPALARCSESVVMRSEFSSAKTEFGIVLRYDEPFAGRRTVERGATRAHHQIATLRRCSAYIPGILDAQARRAARRNRRARLQRHSADAGESSRNRSGPYDRPRMEEPG